MSTELKIGDKVRCICCDKARKLTGKIGTVVEVSGYVIGVDFDSDIDGHTCGGLARMNYGWYMPSYFLEYIGRVNEYTKVVITIEGKVTTAKLMKGRLVLGEAKAYCSPDDGFDALVGAQVALQRLAEQTGSKLVINSNLFNKDNVEIL